MRMRSNGGRTQFTAHTRVTSYFRPKRQINQGNKLSSTTVRSADTTLIYIPHSKPGLPMKECQSCTSVSSVKTVLSSQHSLHGVIDFNTHLQYDIMLLLRLNILESVEILIIVYRVKLIVEKLFPFLLFL